MVITMASYALETPPRVTHAKPPGPIVAEIHLDGESIEQLIRFKIGNKVPFIYYAK